MPNLFSDRLHEYTLLLVMCDIFFSLQNNEEKVDNPARNEQDAWINRKLENPRKYLPLWKMDREETGEE